MPLLEDTVPVVVDLVVVAVVDIVVVVIVFGNVDVNFVVNLVGVALLVVTDHFIFSCGQLIFI